MCPQTCSRVSVPEAKRLKYSDRRNGLSASRLAVSPSYHSSVVMAAKYSARLEAQPRSPAPHRITAVVEQLAVFDHRPSPGGQCRLVHGTIGGALQVERSLARQRDGSRLQAINLKIAPARRRANVRAQLTRLRSDRRRA